jgi:hypothetical protein
LQALRLACGSDPDKGTAKKMGAYVIKTHFQITLLLQQLSLCCFSCHIVILQALCLACGSDPDKCTAEKMGAYVIMTCFHTTIVSQLSLCYFSCHIVTFAGSVPGLRLRP